MINELSNEYDIVEFISRLPGSYPNVMLEPFEKNNMVEKISLAKEVSYIFNKWNVSKPDRQKLVELLINIKGLK